MNYLTALSQVTDHLNDPQVTPNDPVVRAGLDLVVRPWLDGIHTGAEAMHWGELAATVQAVIATLWTGQAYAAIQTSTAVPGRDLNQAASALVLACERLFTRAAATADESYAWTYAAAAAQLADAAKHLP
jgi:hypothetical protein